MRKAPLVAEPYKKDLKEESFLNRLNNILAPFEEESYRELEERYSTLHVIGVPRSGTTLLLQLLCCHLDIGCINNLIAAFWKAPTFGIRLSKKLIPMRIPSSYHSDLGKTKSITEPHEFGYFWSELLGYRELAYQGDNFEKSINWNRLRLVLANMTEVFGRPIAFKSFWMAWHIKKMQQVLPKTCFVFVRRSPVDNALSLLYLRRKLLGSVEKWASMKPAEYEMLREEAYWVQVAGQVFYIEESILEGIRQVRGRNVLVTTYEDLCRNPKVQMSRIVELLNSNGGRVDFVSEPPSSLQPYVEEPETEEERRRVQKAVSKLYGFD